MLVLKERLIISSGHLALVTCFWSTLNRLIPNCATVLGLVCYRYASSEVWGLSSIGAHKSSQWTGLMHGWTHSAGELFLAEMTACYQEMHGLSLRLACTCSTPRISLPTSFYKFTFSWQYVRGTCLNKIRNLTELKVDHLFPHNLNEDFAALLFPPTPVPQLQLEELSFLSDKSP